MSETAFPTSMGANLSLSQLNSKMIRCRKCPRLVEFRAKVSREKRKQFLLEKYWGKPVPGYGDSKASLVVVGLAPAAHGGNRTGRVFTGDSSAKFLVHHLHQAGFSNQATSLYANDGLKYHDCYITAIIRCVPPADKPSPAEMENCFPYFEKEMALLVNARAMLALGKVAFDSIVKLAKKNYGFLGKYQFRHGGKYVITRFPTIYASYHPSPRNTNTGKLTSSMFSQVLREIREDLGIEFCSKPN